MNEEARYWLFCLMAIAAGAFVLSFLFFVVVHP